MVMCFLGNQSVKPSLKIFTIQSVRKSDEEEGSFIVVALHNVALLENETNARPKALRHVS